MATVVATWRSAPRPPGAVMLVGPDGSAVGSVSGGCVEGAVYELALEVAATGTPVLRRYGVSDEDAFAVGLTCGGIIDVFVERVDRDSFPQLGEVAAAYAPPPRMIVFGAIDFAAAVARIGTFLGYRVTVCDARPVFATARRFPDADEVVVDWPHRYLRGEADAGRIDGRTVLCVLTHDQQLDAPLLEVALRLDLAYVGAMGSRRTHAERLDRLRESGLIGAKLARIIITVDGVRYHDDVEPGTLLVHPLREQVGQVGTVVGRDTSNCGACTVLMSDPDGRLVGVKSCAVLAVQADGRQVVTIEGLAGPDNTLHPVQKAFHERHALQCGFCTPGMIMAAVDLLTDNPDPSDAQIREGLEGNLCRCTGYQNIVRAVRDAARDLRESGRSAAPAAPTPLAGEDETPDSGLPREQVPDDAVPQPVP